MGWKCERKRKKANCRIWGLSKWDEGMAIYRDWETEGEFFGGGGTRSQFRISEA